MKNTSKRPVLASERQVQPGAMGSTRVKDALSAVGLSSEPEETSRRILDFVTDGIAVTDLEGVITDVNTRVLEMHGFSTREELLGKSVFDLIAFRDHKKARANMAGTLEKGSVRNIEYALVRADGTEFPCELSASLQEDASGHPLGFIAVTRDITERKRAEAALRESEAKYSTLVEQAKDGMVVVQDGIIEFTNSAQAEMLGYSVEEMLGKPFLEIVDFAFQDKVMRRGETLKAGREVETTIEVKMLCKDGTAKDIETSTATIQYQGRLATLVLVRDITTRKRIEAALRESEERYRLLFEGYGDPVEVFDADGFLLLINETGAARLGGSPEDFVGKAMHELLTESAETYEGRVREVVASGMAKDFEDLVGLPSGERWFWARLQPVKDESGKVVAVQIVSHDITERKRAEEALHKSEERYRLLAENTVDLIWVIDIDTLQPTYVSSSITHVLGYSLEEGTRLTITETFTSESAEIVSRSIQKLLSLESAEEQDRLASQPMELQAKRKDGSTIYVEVKTGLIRDAKGRPISLVGVTRDITERKRAEEGLRQQEEYFHFLIEGSSDAITIVNREGFLAYVSPSYKRVLGYEPENRIGAQMLGLVHPDDTERSTTVLAELLTTPGSTTPPIEARVRHRDGSWRVVETVATNLLEEPAVKGVVFNFRDVTKRKLAEEELHRLLVDLDERVTQRTVELSATNEALTKEIHNRSEVESALRDSEERFRGLFENAPDAMILIGAESGEIKDLNWFASLMLQRSREQIIGLHHSMLAPRGKRQLGGELLDGDLRQGQLAVPRESEIRRADGTTVPVEVSARLFDSKGEQTLLATLRDISARRKAELEAERHAKRMEVLYAIAEIMSSSLDIDVLLSAITTKVSDLISTDGIAIWVSETETGEATLKAHTGFSDTCVAALREIVLSFEDLAEANGLCDSSNLDDWMNGGGAVTRLATVLNGEGLNVVYWSPLLHGGRLIGGMLTSRHSRRRFIRVNVDLQGAIGKHIGVGVQNALLYAREKELREKLEREIESRGNFLRALVHELKTPLTSAMASSEMLSDLLLDEVAQIPNFTGTLAQNLYTSLRNLNRRTDELFDLAKGEVGMLELNPQSVDLLRLLNSVCDDFGPVAVSEGQTLTAQLPVLLPEVWADVERLRQIILNLLGNALKFTPAGGAITIEARERATSVVVTIRDTGYGISPAERQNLFDPYYRGETDRARSRGLGLGLALSKWLVELHGGSIWVTSKEGSGSAFSFSIPVSRDT